MTASYVLGIDLGQSPDLTAVALLEYDHVQEPVYRLRGLYRFPRGTRYTELADPIGKRLDRPPIKNHVNVAVDATGPGRPMVDYLTETLPPAPLHAITITSGTEVTGGRRDPRVPKRDLISTTSLVLEQGRIRIAEKMEYTEALLDEFVAYRRTISERGSDTYSAPSRSHDDLLLAVALAVWTAENRNPPPHSNWIGNPNDPRLGPPIDITDGFGDIYE